MIEDRSSDEESNMSSEKSQLKDSENHIYQKLQELSDISSSKDKNYHASYRSELLLLVIIFFFLQLGWGYIYLRSTLQSSKTDGFDKTNTNALATTESDYDSCLSTELSIETRNEYGVLKSPYPFLLNGEQLVEPYKDTNMSIIGGDLLDSGNFSFVWRIHYTNNSLIQLYGKDIVLNLVTPGSYYMRVKAVKEDNSVYCIHETTVYVK
jgi:hypothetical protein